MVVRQVTEEVLQLSEVANRPAVPAVRRGKPEMGGKSG